MHRIVLVLHLLLGIIASVSGSRTFVIDSKIGQFLKDGKPFRYVSGSMDYFRVPRAYWRDRMNKMKMAGINTVTTNVVWSEHQPEPEILVFDGNYDIAAFCREALNLGLLVILRVGPYIGADVDNGGIPYWLIRQYPGVKYRSTDSNFMKPVETWFHRLLTSVRKSLYKYGGPVIALQIENQYGAYPGCDVNYMATLIRLVRQYVQDDVVLFHSDLAWYAMLKCGAVPGVFGAAAIRPTQYPSSVAAVLKSVNPSRSPLVVSDYYVAESDVWRAYHHTSSIQLVKYTLRILLSMNYSVNINMFHGGTNFGFSAGSRVGWPVTTSYDCDAPLSEAGDPRPLYYLIRKVIAEFHPLPRGEVPTPSEKLFLGVVAMTRSQSLRNVMSHFRQNNWLKRRSSLLPTTFEALGQDFGFVVYRTSGDLRTNGYGYLVISGLQDRGYIYTKKSRLVLYSKAGYTADYITVSKGEELVIVVENVGRESVGKRNKCPKGIIGNVTLNGHTLVNWVMEAVPIASQGDITRIVQIPVKEGAEAAVPGFFYGTFRLPEGRTKKDTFLDVTGWGRGVVFLNGVNLGRYWPKKGPQQTLYLPAPFMWSYPDENTILLLEMESVPRGQRTVKLVDRHIINGSIS